MNAFSSFILNHQKLQTIQMSINREMEKESVVHPNNRISLSNKKEQTSITQVKAADRKCYILYDPIYRTFWKKSMTAKGYKRV